MATITGPRQGVDPDDAQMDCEQALDDHVRDLIDEAITAGWPPHVVFAALKSVVDNRELAYAEDPDPAPDP
ncbi:hypothetical protein B5M44_04010 [Shinella sumterensis]|uniref:hypothetical protein n=1 Tax=Shinella sumterensis TaxID=1967501 RepID=UPI00106EC62F|nr:hypothetical protein [Shinella sumterensis]MCD1264092.1 hypothetical protein [Shinella sumterensis]TFE99377.1 hypothetical protein B5M44_04010 [Shinella sumterensis]